MTLDLIKRDIKLRYLGSLFGGYWNFIHPLAMIIIFTAVFSQVMKVRLGSGAGTSGNYFSYTIYLCSALLPWNAFLETVSRGTRTFLENSWLIKKMSFPMELLHTVVAGSAAITFLIAFSLYLLVIFAVGFGVSWPIICLPLIFCIQTVFAIGLGMFFSILNVFFRDIEQVIGILFQVWFWLTPIVYLQDLLPERFKIVLYGNPLFYFAEMYHDVVFRQAWPHWPTMAAMAVLSVLVFFLGASFMCRFKNDVPDEI